MRIAWSEELGCMILDGVPLGMPGQPRAEGKFRPAPKSPGRDVQETSGSFSDSPEAAAHLD
jgi:hypothetical protein